MIPKGHTGVRVLAVVEYDGTDFAGFQIQAHQRGADRTVQGELERAVLACTQETVRVIGSGRTDAGVHARGQVIHFDTQSRLAGDLPTFQRALNAHLPDDVQVQRIQAAPDDFHARFWATRRTYCYRLLNGVAPSPLLRRYAQYVRAPLDTARMSAGARHLEGTHDFVAFASQEGPGRTIRDLFGVQVRQSWANRAQIWHTIEQASGAAPPAAALMVDESRLIEIEVEASGFLRHMMRRIVGTLLRVGDGRLEPDDVAAILAARNKDLAGPTVPARGLCLERIAYGRSAIARSEEKDHDQDVFAEGE